MQTTDTATILDPLEDPVVLRVVHDGDLGTTIRINHDVDLGIEQARAVGTRLLVLADELTPAVAPVRWPLRMALEAINERRGTSHTPESVAASLGIDLGAATEADVTRLARHVGGVLMH